MSGEHDAFSRTAAALAATYREHGALLDATPAQFRNYMLDLCGSDHSALVDLLLSLGPQLRARLSMTGSPAAWQVRRAPIIHQVVATRYLQPDVARWLVDAWGAALNVAPQQIERPTVVSVADQTLVATDFARAVVAPPPATAVRPKPAPLPPPPPARGGRAPRGRSGLFAAKSTSVASTARPVKARPSPLLSGMTMAQAAQLQRLERVSLVAMALAGIGVFIAAWFALSTQKSSAVANAAVLPAIEPLSSADSISRNATGSMHSLPQSTTDSVVTADIAAPLLMTPSAADGPHLIAAGLGGRYRVIQRVRSVSGSRNCDKVADALAKGRTTVEVVSHTPGTFSFAIASRNVAGTLMPDAEFEAGPQSGTTDGVTWRFHMQGHFTPGGFVGESQTSTDAIIRWGRSQSCFTVTDLVGERLPP